MGQRPAAAHASRACTLARARARRRMFIGQGGGKAAGGGMPQREQKAVLAAFRAGAFNTLVATCIGEEGLDIPQAPPAPRTDLLVTGPWLPPALARSAWTSRGRRPPPRPACWAPVGAARPACCRRARL